jgi:ribosomal protein L30/L7E
MIAAITIRGCVTAKKSMVKTLEVMKMKKKFSMRFFEKNDHNLKMLKKVEAYVMFGEVSKEVKEEIVKKMGEKSVYNLHPPRGGFKSSIKQVYPSGEAGYRGKEIEEYIRRMVF